MACLHNSALGERAVERTRGLSTGRHALEFSRYASSMASYPLFDDSSIEAISKILGECGSGTDITSLFGAKGFVDNSGESTKWRRLRWVMVSSQRQHGCGNHVLDLARGLLAPPRFVGKSALFEERRGELNAVLAFSGLEYGADGQFRSVTAATTIGEAERRTRTLNARLHGRRIHAEVIRYCRTELMQENYFHAVFEATKGLAQRIRSRANVDGDGAALVDRVFGGEKPVLALNSLQTESDRSEHRGFAALLKGCFAGIRNPLAHDPKILWDGEDDAADYLTMISLMHRKLDGAVVTGFRPPTPPSPP